MQTYAVHVLELSIMAYLLSFGDESIYFFPYIIMAGVSI